jgi:hypothetical protein
MTNTKVGTDVNAQAAGKSTQAITTLARGDLVVMFLEVNSATISATALSSTRIRWKRVANWVGPSPMTMNFAMFMGVVQTVGTDTITATYSATIGTNLVQWTGKQYHNDLGLPWTLQTNIFGTTQNGSAGTSMTLPSLSSLNAGSLAVGMMVPQNTGTSGATSGWNYLLDGFTSVMADNLNVAAGALTPATATMTSGRYISGMAIFVPAAPIAAYSFDDSGSTINDDSGNGRTITPADNVTRSASGKVGGGLTTTGGSTAGTMAAFGQTADRTLMLDMINPPAVTNWIMLWQVNSINSGAWGILLLPTQVTVQARNASTFVRSAATRPTDGLWHHYCATYDSLTNTLSMYLDGVLAQAQTLAGPLRTDADIINLMEISSTSCVIDNVRAYDRVLTLEQIADLAATPVVSTATPSIPPGNMLLGYS